MNLTPEQKEDAAKALRDWLGTVVTICETDLENLQAELKQKGLEIAPIYESNEPAKD